MTDAILALNAGSSSIKFALYPADGDISAIRSGLFERIGGASQLRVTSADGTTSTAPAYAADHEAAFALILEGLLNQLPDTTIVAVGHRIVHGGAIFSDPVELTPDVLIALEDLTLLAPLHQPHGLRCAREVTRRIPSAVQVACFDTAFHAAKSRLHDTFGIPRKFYDEGLRRYGFHGLSCQSVLRKLRAMGYPVDDRRIVIAHLGNGCSATAILGGVGHASSMGFSTLDGLIMGTRCGRLDPGVILFWLRQGKSLHEIEDILYHHSGLAGLSGFSNDMRDLSQSSDPAAIEAIEVFVACIVEEICRLAGTMGGLDAVVFCGGIGENAGHIRRDVAQGLAFLSPGGPEILVMKTDEESEILVATRQTLRDRTG
ncbi:MAG: acetate kinase [Pseudomonadota bacterium]